MPALVALATVLGCDRKHPEPPAPAPPPTTTTPAASPASDAAPAAGGCTLAALPVRRPMPARLVAIGDVHGDLAALRGALKAAGAIDDADRWIGGELVVVQTGDLLDRGDDEQAIFDLLARLEREAAAAGGALILLIGNHELMNAAGDFRYVTAAGMTDFADAPGVDTTAWRRVPEPQRERIAALGPGGVYARWIASHAVVAIVGDTVFSHAGVIGAWAGRIDATNQAARCWLAGQAGSIREPPAALVSQDSPVWTRAYGGDPADCTAARAALDALGATRMVVGHTVQRGGITDACDGAVWRIDVGMSRSYGGPIEVLELAPGAGAPRVRKGKRAPP